MKDTPTILRDPTQDRGNRKFNGRLLYNNQYIASFDTSTPSWPMISSGIFYRDYVASRPQR